MATKMDPIQIQRASFDEDAQAVRVAMAPTQMSVQLTHEDGDSVYSHKKMQVIECVAGQIVDTSLVETICCTSGISISTIVLGEEISMGTLLPMALKQICVPTIKVSTACKLILRG
ncbi:MAG: hypothetical protein EBZ95_04870 [Chitinophagia bacterium]|nr:hypothetical protein [Chitinophagia bacterium]